MSPTESPPETHSPMTVMELLSLGVGVVHVPHWISPRNPLTDDSDGRVQPAVLSEHGGYLQLGEGFVGVGVIGGALHPRPETHSAVPADDGVKDAAVVLKQETFFLKNHFHSCLVFALKFVTLWYLFINENSSTITATLKKVFNVLNCV